MRDACGRFAGRLNGVLKDKHADGLAAYWSDPQRREEQAQRLDETRKSLAYRAKLTEANRRSGPRNRRKLRAAWALRREREQGGAVPPGFEDFYAYMTRYKPQGWKFWNCQVLLMCLEIELALLKVGKGACDGKGRIT